MSYTTEDMCPYYRDEQRKCPNFKEIDFSDKDEYWKKHCDYNDKICHHRHTKDAICDLKKSVCPHCGGEL
jgi:hypothetical protein